jgi:hypothetical protein
MNSLIEITKQHRNRASASQERAGGRPGNSGAEIARELAPRQRTWLSGRNTSYTPRLDRIPIANRLYWWIIRHLLNTDRRLGRWFKELVGTKGAVLVGLPLPHARVRRTLFAQH